MTAQFTPDGDAIIPGWEHTPDGEYRPKDVKYGIDGDMYYKGQTVTQRKFDEIRKTVYEDPSTSWM